MADILKERIYATFALIAVLATIDTDHTASSHAAILISATIASLWAASIVATSMSRRIVFKNRKNHEQSLRRELAVHAPMLFSLAFPLLMIGISGMGAISLLWAVNISIASTVFLMIGWSIRSARPLHSRTLPLIALIAFQIAVGFGVVVLKIAAGH